MEIIRCKWTIIFSFFSFFLLIQTTENYCSNWKIWKFCLKIKIREQIIKVISIVEYHAGLFHLSEGMQAWNSSFLEFKRITSERNLKVKFESELTSWLEEVVIQEAASFCRRAKLEDGLAGVAWNIHANISWVFRGWSWLFFFFLQPREEKWISRRPNWMMISKAADNWSKIIIPPGFLFFFFRINANWIFKL